MDRRLEWQTPHGCGTEVHSGPLQVYVQVPVVCTRVLQVYKQVLREDCSGSEDEADEEDRTRPIPDYSVEPLLAALMEHDTQQGWKSVL